MPVLLAGVLAAVVAATATAAPSQRATLTGSAPPWATSSNFKGATSGSDAVGFRVYLGWRGNAEAAAQNAVATHQYLTPQQFRQQFAPAQADVNAVKNWLTSQGFTVDYTPTNNLYVAAEGTVAQAAAAFGVTFDEYTVNGLTLRAPSSDISVPSSLAGTVDAVMGLDQSAALVHYDHSSDAPAPGGFRNARPCSAWWGQQTATGLPKIFGSTSYPYAVCGYDATMLRGAYGLGDAFTAKYNGAGQTVAIIDAYASPTILSDVNTYSDRHGLPEFQGNQFSQVVAPGTYRSAENYRQDPQGWSVEETLDVESVHSMAPGANVVYVGAPNNYQDLDAALNHVVDRGLAQIVTNSYGWSTELLPSGYIKPYEDILVQAAAEGIGVYFSSGDNGDETQVMGYRTADWPASSPWVTAVGGTSLGIGSTNNYLWETYWGTDKYTLQSNNTWKTIGWIYAGGGGTSQIFGEPSYQSGIADPFAGYFGGNGRVVPDVSMVGDPTTGILMGQTQQFPNGTYYDEFREGGTSLASPLFAGVMADADQAAGHPHGFANPALYSLYGSAAFRDVAPQKGIVAAVRKDYVNGVDDSAGIVTSLRTIGDTLTLTSKNGYDDANGVGSPNGQQFLSAMATK